MDIHIDHFNFLRRLGLKQSIFRKKMNILTIFEDGRIGGPHKQFFYFFKTLSKKIQTNIF